MSLKEKIEKDFQVALKKKEGRLSVLRLIKAAVANAEIEKHGRVKDLTAKLTDEEVLAVLRRQAKQTEEALPDFEKGGRRDLAEQAKAELAILKSYLPAGLSEAELNVLVETTIQEMGAVGPRDLGRVMGAVMKTAGGRAEGNVVKEMVSERLKD